MASYRNGGARLKNCFERIKKMDISKKDRELITKFKREAEVVGSGKKRIVYYLNRIKKLLEFKDKPFEEMSKEDIKELVREIESGEITKDNGEEYSPWSKRAFRLTIKKLFQISAGYGWEEKQYPEKVDWVSTAVNKKGEQKYEILTEEEIKRMVRAGEKPRDKALIITLYESGARIGEFLNLRIKDLSFVKNGVKLNLEGKTGARKVLLVSSSPHLSNWLDHHPHKNERNAPLWTNYRRNKLGYKGARKIIDKLAEKAGVDKPVNPHNFRHSRATHLANELTEAQMCEYFGWVQGSDQPATYVHLSGRDVDNAILNVYGIEKEEKESNGEKLQLKKCPRCEKKNSPEADYCQRCGAPLTEEAWEVKEEEMETSLDVITEGFMEKLVEKMVREKGDELRKKILKELEKS